MKSKYIKPTTETLGLLAESMLAMSPQTSGKVRVSEESADEILSNKRQPGGSIWKE